MPSTTPSMRQAGTIGRQVLRYAVTGGIAMVVTMIVYAAGWRILTAAGVRGDYLLADVAGWAAGMSVNYVLSSRWVFQRPGASKAPVREFSIFALIGLIGLVWSQLGLWMLVGRWGVQRDLAKLIMIGAVFAWNFSIRRAWLLRTEALHG
jgi:putative flippase GtrA